MQICYHRNGDLRWEQIKGSSKVARVNASPLVYGPVQLARLSGPTTSQRLRTRAMNLRGGQNSSGSGFKWMADFIQS